MTWRNWGRNQTATPATLLLPRDVGELAAAVKHAADAGRRVKAVGSGHSFTATAVAPDIQVDLRHLRGLRASTPPPA